MAEQYDDLPPDLRLGAFLEEVALVSDQDQLAEEQDRVTLLTLHTAKGLEYQAVFIVGLEENIFPHSRSLEDPDQLEEERRLMYVGVTRAKDRLYLVRAFRRTLYGRSEVNAPSRFLIDIPEKLQVGGGIGDRKAAIRQATENVTRWGPQGSNGRGDPTVRRRGRPCRWQANGAGRRRPAAKPAGSRHAASRSSSPATGSIMVCSARGSC